MPLYELSGAMISPSGKSLPQSEITTRYSPGRTSVRSTNQYQPPISNSSTPTPTAMAAEGLRRDLMEAPLEQDRRDMLAPAGTATVPDEVGRRNTPRYLTGYSLGIVTHSGLQSACQSTDMAFCAVIMAAQEKNIPIFSCPRGTWAREAVIVARSPSIPLAPRDRARPPEFVPANPSPFPRTQVPPTAPRPRTASHRPATVRAARAGGTPAALDAATPPPAAHGPAR